MADDDMITITLPDGKEKKFNILFTFEHEEKDYVVFAPLDGMEEFFVAKVNPQTDGSGTLDEVDDEAVYDKAQELLDEYFDDIISEIPEDEIESHECHCGHCDGDCECDHEHGDDCNCDDCKN